MKNMEIIILTSIICTLFVVFIFGPLLYAHKISGGRETSSKPFKKGKGQKKILKRIDRTIADMESEGIYFSEDVKKELKKQREELLCQYSGLPSVKSYEKNK